ncbi:MAG TPA: hypothetical protein VIJ82_11705 [Streptosporangiaceae bacterium]
MIKIRYAELPAGLHVRAEARGRSTIIFLLPGLTPAQRRAALIRARRSASLGHGPSLPAAGVALAVTVDQIKATLRNGLLAFRAHPLLLFPPVIIAATATLVYIMLASGTLVIRSPQAGGPFPQPGPVPGRPGPSRSAAPADRPASGGGPGSTVAAGHRRPGRPAPSPHPSRSAGHSTSPSPSPSTSPSPSPSPQPTGQPGPTSAPGSPSPSPTFPPSPSPSSSCLKLGALGICLTL